MKLNLGKLASEAAAFSGLSPEQVPGLELLFGIVEREAFCDGVRLGRSSSFATDPALMHDTYAAPAPASEFPPSVDAVDPHVSDPGTPSPRVDE